MPTNGGCGGSIGRLPFEHLTDDELCVVTEDRAGCCAQRAPEGNLWRDANYKGGSRERSVHGIGVHGIGTARLALRLGTHPEAPDSSPPR